LSTFDERAEREITSIREIVERVDSLQRSGYGVILFRARELYKMSAYVNRHTKSRIHFAIGLSVLMRVFEDRYNDLPGRLLEGIARLFTQNVRISVYPMTARDAQRRMTPEQSIEWKGDEINGIISAVDIHLSGPLDSLYQYLLRSELLVPAKLTANESSPAPQSSSEAQSIGGQVPFVSDF
jgi:hypothetical protein